MKGVLDDIEAITAQWQSKWELAALRDTLSMHDVQHDLYELLGISRLFPVVCWEKRGRYCQRSGAAT
jgi:hypothetical protein